MSGNVISKQCDDAKSVLLSDKQRETIVVLLAGEVFEIDRPADSGCRVI
jgi:succinyl-CoA synthetase beta subunit